ncbi:MAG: serine/threonine protein kinase [Deltaproteobacteria bacterium]|nr:serine/threonine protein kinase [Deltaproteobacteria bacterium]
MPDEELDLATEGTILAQRYQVERLVGVGGMGYVVRAKQIFTDQPVAVKLLLPERARDRAIVARFLREARAAARLKNEHVCRILDVGILDDGVPYIAMEYLDGQDLGTVLKERGALTVREAVACVRQACEAVAEAHALGIVHRDLKPHNLFLSMRPDGTGSIKVLDFGIAKILDPQSEQLQLTSDGAILGSPAYMAPEQMMSAKSVDPRADIWALGVVLFELLGGRGPFAAPSVNATCARVLTQPAPRLGDLGVEVPAGLEALIARCLEKDRERRLGSVAELVAGLEPFAR